eukprot:m.30980 g.30980  ORF g.30980 m.30980 type:complete len:110 (+) comp12023_c0_seq1:86-415(+)
MAAQSPSLSNQSLQDALDMNHALLQLTAVLQSRQRFASAEKTLQTAVESLIQLGRQVDQLQEQQPHLQTAPPQSNNTSNTQVASTTMDFVSDPPVTASTGTDTVTSHLQ